MKMTSRVLFICFFIGYFVIFAWSAFSYFEPTPKSTSTPTPMPTVQSTVKTGVEKPGAVEEKVIPWKDYQEALKNEREELQKQAKENLERMDKLQDRIFSAIVLLGGLILAFIYFLFGQTRKEVKTQLTEEISKNVRSQVEQEVLSTIKLQIEAQVKTLEAMNCEMAVTRDGYRKLDSELKEMQSYKDRQILWFFSGETNTAEREIAALWNAGFENIQPQNIKSEEPFELGNPDLVIFSYDKSDEGKRRMRVIASLMRKNIPNVWLLIHTTSQAIKEEEEKILGDLWYFPTNFSATLVTNAQALIRRRHKF